MPNWATHIAQSKNLAFRVCSAHGGQQRVLDLLGLNLQTAGSCLVGSGAQTWVLWKRPALLTLEPLQRLSFHLCGGGILPGCLPILLKPN